MEVVVPSTSDTGTESLKNPEPEAIKRKRNKRKCEDSWKQNIRKKNKNLGLAYETKAGLKPAKQPKLNSCGCKNNATYYLKILMTQNRNYLMGTGI